MSVGQPGYLKPASSFKHSCNCIHLVFYKCARTTSVIHPLICQNWINPSHLAICDFFAILLWLWLPLSTLPPEYTWIHWSPLLDIFVPWCWNMWCPRSSYSKRVPRCLPPNSRVPWSSNMWVLSRCWLAGSLGRVVRGKTGGTVGSTSPPPPTTLIPSPNHYRQDGMGEGGKFCGPLLDSFCLDIGFSGSAQGF